MRRLLDSPEARHGGGRVSVPSEGGAGRVAQQCLPRRHGRARRVDAGKLERSGTFRYYRRVYNSRLSHSSSKWRRLPVQPAARQSPSQPSRSMRVDPPQRTCPWRVLEGPWAPSCIAPLGRVRPRRHRLPGPPEARYGGGGIWALAEDEAGKAVPQHVPVASAATGVAMATNSRGGGHFAIIGVSIIAVCPPPLQFAEPRLSAGRLTPARTLVAPPCRRRHAAPAHSARPGCPAPR